MIRILHGHLGEIQSVITRSSSRRFAQLRVVETVDSYRHLRQTLLQQNHKAGKEVKIGLVPTMGALHEGHLSLVQKARKENDILVSTIFVNPTQFAAHEDLSKYPRPLDRDLELLQNEGVDVVLVPSEREMYGKHDCTFVEARGFDGGSAEGGARPEHFRGVATIVTKLFNIVQPHRAYFGQKDAMQCVLIRRVTEDLHIPTEIVVCPTVRSKEGLALSSRNQYLNEEEHAAAPVVYRALSAIKEAYESEKGQNIPGVPVDSLVERGRQIFHSEPLVKKIEYISVASKNNMEELT